MRREVRQPYTASWRRLVPLLIALALVAGIPAGLALARLNAAGPLGGTQIGLHNEQHSGACRYTLTFVQYDPPRWLVGDATFDVDRYVAGMVMVHIHRYDTRSYDVVAGYFGVYAIQAARCASLPLLFSR